MMNREYVLCRPKNTLVTTIEPGEEQRDGNNEM